MEYWNIPLTCDCGKVPKFVSPPGLTADHQLLVHWHCTRCQRHVYFLKPLSDCWQVRPNSGKETASAMEKVSPSDRRFLRSIGVKDPDEIELR